MSSNRWMLEEINIRQEVLDLISGKDFGEEHFTPLIHRKIRRDSQNERVKCVCWDKESNEGKLGCGDCDGMGYLWDENIILGFVYFITTKNMISGYEYMNQSGRSDKYELGLITPYNIVVGKADRVIVPLMSEEGAIRFPIIIDDEYNVINNRKYRLDHGKQEYNIAILSR